MTSSSYAFDITAGATAWHANWDSNKPIRESYELQGARSPAFLYGPAISLKFNDDFNLTFVYLYGEFADNINSVFANITGKAKIKRNDSDLALNYRLNNLFKIFVGIKYINFEYSVSTIMNDYNKTLCDNDFEHNGIGPGLGLSATLPVAENLFLVGTFSGFYLWGNEKENYYEVKYVTIPTPSVQIEEWSDKYKYKEYGVNSNISFAVYIPPSIAISLGWRYQYAKAVYKDSMYNNTSKFHGLNLAATYTFSI